MAFIEVHNLVREFRSPRRFGGRLGTLRTILTREYDTRRAIDNISFTVERGEAVGYLGPNGAGKSTTIKILTGILVPTEGTVRVGDLVPYRDRVQNARRMGVVFGQRSQLWWDLPLKDSFDLHRHIYRIPDTQFRRNQDFCEELLGVGEFRNTAVRQLSLGQRMRGEVALALLHGPEILFLDEPTIGLDVLVKDRIRAFLKAANRELGTTVILTTHDLRDIEEICPRLLVVDHGHLVWDGAVSELKARFQAMGTLTVEFETDPGPIPVPNAELVVSEGRHKTYRYDRRATNAPALLAYLLDLYHISDAGIAEADIESVIRSLYLELEHRDRGGEEKHDSWTPTRVVVQ